MPVRVWRQPLNLPETLHPKVEVHILKNQCKGCGFCIRFCPQNVLEESEEINERGVHPPRVVDGNKCVLCSFCTSVCPDFAIFVVEKPSKS